MSLHETILELEKATWEALKLSGIKLMPYLSQDCIMLFSGAGIIFAADSEPSLHEILVQPDMKTWTHYELHDVRVIPFGEKAASISYRVVAARGKDEYEALITSIWRDEGQGFKLVVHQQTPLDN